MENELGSTKVLQIPEELFELATKRLKTGWISNEVEIKFFSREDVGKIQKSSIKAKASLGATDLSATFDHVDWVDMTVLHGVVKAPWGINDLASVRRLPDQIITWIFKEINDFNTLGIKKNTESSLQSAQEEPQTQK